MLPEKCQQCAKSKKTKVRTECRICADTKFEETVLCELHRSVQLESDEFECHAFTPVLSVAGSEPPLEAWGQLENPRATQLAISKLMSSDKIKYQTALALQKLTEDPDATIIELKFHFAWSVEGRMPIFRHSEKYAGIVSEVLTATTIPSVRRANLLWLAPDHLHVYCDSDGERSVEETVIGLKEMLARGISEKLPDLIKAMVGKEGIWEDSYFAESLDSF